MKIGIIGSSNIGATSARLFVRAGHEVALSNSRGGERPSILSEATDAARVREVVMQHRQRISQAKSALEADLGKEFSQRTLVRFLKNLTADINA